MAQAKYYVMLLMVTVVWGATPASGKLLVDAMSPLLITGLRFLIIALLLFSWLYLSGQKKAFRPDKRTLFIFAAMGFMGVLVHNGLLFTGLHYTTATNTALIESIGPTVTTVLAFLFLGERLNKSGWLGILISCVGAVCIVTHGSLEILLSLSFNIGDLIIIAAEAAWSAYVIISWFVNGKATTVQMTAWMGFFGAVMCFITGGVTGTLTVGTIDALAIGGFTYLTLASGVFAFVGWNWACAGVGASKAGSFVYIVPLTGAIFGTVFLGEHLGFGQILGAALIIGGVIITVRAKVSLKTQKKAQEPVNPLEKYPELTEHYHKERSRLREERLAYQEKLAKSGSFVQAEPAPQPMVSVENKDRLEINLKEGFLKPALTAKHQRLERIIKMRRRTAWHKAKRRCILDRLKA